MALAGAAAGVAVTVVAEGETGGAADGADAGDVLVATTFRPYAPETLAVATTAGERGAVVIALTDLPTSPLAALADHCLLVRDGEVDGVRSLSASMCLATILVVAAGKAARPGPETAEP